MKRPRRNRAAEAQPDESGAGEAGAGELGAGEAGAGEALAVGRVPDARAPATGRMPAAGRMRVRGFRPSRNAGAPDRSDGTAGGDEPTAAKKPPLYPRLLRLRHIRPNVWQRALLGEGALALAVLLVLADLATAWTLLVLPVAVAVVVKANDVLAGLLKAEQSAGPRSDPAPAEHPKRQTSTREAAMSKLRRPQTSTRKAATPKPAEPPKSADRKRFSRKPAPPSPEGDEASDPSEARAGGAVERPTTRKR